MKIRFLISLTLAYLSLCSPCIHELLMRLWEYRSLQRLSSGLPVHPSERTELLSVTSFCKQDREDKCTGVMSPDFCNCQRILQAADEQGEGSTAAKRSAGFCVGKSAREKYGLLKGGSTGLLNKMVYFSFYRLVGRR